MESYMSITKNDEVTDINQVKIKRSIITEVHDDTEYTLEEIDDKIAKVQARIEHLQGDITELQTLRATILAEAKKVKLKIDLPPEKMEV